MTVTAKTKGASLRTGSVDMCLAIPGRILEISMAEGVRVGRVEFGGVVRQASLDFVPHAEVGDFVMVHVGFAISRVDRQEAERTYEALKATGMLEQELSPEGS